MNAGWRAALAGVALLAMSCGRDGGRAVPGPGDSTAGPTPAAAEGGPGAGPGGDPESRHAPLGPASGADPGPASPDDRGTSPATPGLSPGPTIPSWPYTETITPKVAPVTAPPGLTLADETAGPLRFTMIRVYEDGGRFAAQANMTNGDADYLNGIEVTWRIMGGGGAELDRGRATWPNLAPGETATLHLAGSSAFADSVASIDFDYAG